jgi:hypothetical protein
LQSTWMMTRDQATTLPEAGASPCSSLSVDCCLWVYLRVSTGEQTTENQRRELEDVAQRSGWKIVAVYEDAGISGARGRDRRPAFDKVCRAVPAETSSWPHRDSLPWIR